MYNREKYEISLLHGYVYDSNNKILSKWVSLFNYNY